MRIRTVKPEFWQSETLGELDREVRMLAAALLTMADDEGFFRSHPALVAGSLMPFDEDGQRFVAHALEQLAGIGFVELYEGGVGHVVTFKDHQRINRPSVSKLKIKATVPKPRLSEPSVRPHTHLSEASLLEGKGSGREVEQGSGGGGAKQVSPPPLPKLPDNKFASGEAFWAWVQHQRVALGYITEKAPRKPLGPWWSEVMMELNGKPEPLEAALSRFGSNKYWATADPPWPFGAFMKDWRDYVHKRA